MVSWRYGIPHLMFNLISHKWAQLKEKFHISTHACIILYVLAILSIPDEGLCCWQHKWEYLVKCWSQIVIINFLSYWTGFSDKGRRFSRWCSFWSSPRWQKSDFNSWGQGDWLQVSFLAGRKISRIHYEPVFPNYYHYVGLHTLAFSAKSFQSRYKNVHVQ